MKFNYLPLCLNIPHLKISKCYFKNVNPHFFPPCSSILLGLSKDNKIKIIMSLPLAFHDFPDLVITAWTTQSSRVFSFDVTCK